ncbi:hypothetical protein [Yoonia sediminilitoris]|uniref:Uncharacterized protein n=1 Tax=Yoonia sediminilitoris TaxID=1286148 RepID=A0A2T6K846_9RHOB|nr:hypothetical protein [Yoonia sediminilitoris]PUB10868.1 hypothetical protein C8N45_11640 [Yoonia sediminilitoris]RCW90543.1 hypothetical protein DFP92_11640 [Yoonia sediminilitoris]
MPSLRVGIYAISLYIVIIALGMGYAYRFDGTLYGTSEMITHF